VVAGEDDLGCGVLGCVLFAITLPDRQTTERPAFGWLDLARTYWVNPRHSPNFGWAWLSGLLVFLDVAAIQAYQPLYLIAVLHYSPADVAPTRRC
jgi:hypothetical protein